MKVNMGEWDRVIRTTIAAVLLMLLYAGVFSSTLNIIFGVVAAIFLLTSVVGVCPLYSLLGIQTCPRKSGEL